MKTEGQEQSSAAFQCSQCGDRAQWCSFCDRDDCDQCLCYVCTATLLRETMVHPHPHGG